MKLNINPTGAYIAGLDIADEGKDKNAFCGRQGILVNVMEEWSGKNADIFDSVEKSFRLCDLHGINIICYDGDGLGAGVRGDARIINDKRRAAAKPEMLCAQFRGSGAVVDPTRDPLEFFSGVKPAGRGRTNEDYFANAKAQAWWDLRYRFQETYKAINGKTDFNPDSIISLSGQLNHLNKLISEISQPTYSENNVGKILVDKMPDGSISPNLADALMICFSRQKRTVGFWT